MASFRVRPRFEIETDQPIPEIIERVKISLKNPDAPCRGIAMQDHITLRMPDKERHFWSPQLSILMLEHENQPSKIRLIGTYGPMPNVWTMFALSYLAIGVLFTFISIVGFSQKMLGMDSNILWLLPALAIVALILYLLSQFRQKLGAEQMFTLHHFFEESIGQKIHIGVI